ncbi:hypothetical protein [Flavonifractor plautii]|uniref:Uncharacterized protein n=1 Tax=Flavonifractor plautii TaxID=292800 RepID=A0A6I2RE03_FLAPL|nr:hypothetical protein [Flavonifractor plautii]MSB21432.1 hypothetical protein [Flavonifractor plautii]MSB84245.1 hypothetical protein [Flavonifractor plautii]
MTSYNRIVDESIELKSPVLFSYKKIPLARRIQQGGCHTGTGPVKRTAAERSQL